MAPNSLETSAHSESPRQPYALRRAMTASRIERRFVAFIAAAR